MRATILAAVIFAASISGCSGCGRKAEQSASTPPPCTAAWCGEVQQACAAWFAQCPGLASMADAASSFSSSGCVDGLGAIIQTRKNDAGDDAAKELLDCMTSAKSCADATACRDALLGNGGEVETLDAAPADFGLFTDAPLVPPGTVLLPGDDPGCVQCALASCRMESSNCFVDSTATPACWADPDAYPPNVDCCVDFRQCVDGCLASDPDAGAAFSLCASQCDTDYPKGKAQFDTYRTCMTAKCATCGGADAGP